jgi:hypothetical protein
MQKNLLRLKSDVITFMEFNYFMDKYADKFVVMR